MDGMEQTGTPAVAFEHVTKRFGDAVAVNDVNLSIDEGAFVTIIGSSGCGKTTLLNSGDKGRTEAAVTKWMDIIGLPRDIMDRYPAELSGGQAQRVGIARALAASPDILLADEPFSAVDAITRASLQDEIKRIHEQTGITVLFVTHDIDEALDLGDRVLVMEAGRAVQFAPPEEILRAPATEFVNRLVSRKQSVYAR